MKTKKASHVSRWHPVLGNGSDFPSQTFEAQVAVELRDGNWEIRTQFKCDNESIRTLVEEGKAAYSLETDCPYVPFSKKSHKSQSEQCVVRIPFDEVARKITVTARVIASTDIPEYDPKGRNPAFSNKTAILRNEVLAEEPLGTRGFSLGSVPKSLIRIKKSVCGSKVVKFQNSEDVFWIILPAKDYKKWLSVQAFPDLARRAYESFLPMGVAEAARVMDENPTQAWSRSLRRRCKFMGIKHEGRDPNEVAQELLKLPFSRAIEMAAKTKEYDR